MTTQVRHDEGAPPAPRYEPVASAEGLFQVWAGPVLLGLAAELHDARWAAISPAGKAVGGFAERDQAAEALSVAWSLRR